MDRPAKRNLGCASQILAGYCNVDKFGEPIFIGTLGLFLAGRFHQGRLLNQVLEHLGQTHRAF
jgi:hypothetical protein